MAVLYFDDDPLMSSALAQNLRLAFHWNVTLVPKINELFEQLNNYQFDIIILDIMTPVPETENVTKLFTKNEIKEMEGGMSTGIVLAQKIWEKNKNIPILFLSARSQPNNAIVKFKTEGKRCEYLRKPELAKTVDATLDNLLNQK